MYFQEEGAIKLTVENLNEENGERSVHVSGKLKDRVFSGVLRRWKCYSGPETPYPLADDDLVTFSHLLDSNTAVVCSPDSDKMELNVQKVCYKCCGEYSTANIL